MIIYHRKKNKEREGYKMIVVKATTLATEYQKVTCPKKIS
jgi:hypothetical protein